MPFVKRSFHVKEKMPAFLFLIRHFGLSQGEAQRLIAKGRLLLEGESMFDTSAKIHGEIEIVYFEPVSRGERPVFYTKDFALFEKKSGVLVHPKTMKTPYSLLDEIRTHAGDHANAVHRIDMETSGLLMASKHKKAESFLKSSFEKRTIHKSYLAWVDGKIEQSFSVDVPLKIRDDYAINKHKVCVSDEGKQAYTYFKPLEYDSVRNASLLACYPHTGRTHQIRVHLFHVKHPILGDPIYGASFAAANDYLEGKLSDKERLRETGASRLMLHAQSLKFHYKSDFEIHSKVDFKGMRELICPAEERRFNFGLLSL